LTEFIGVNDRIHLSASSDAPRLTAINVARMRDIYLGDLREGAQSLGSLQRFTLDQRDDVSPTWTAEGAAIVFASNRRGNWDIYKQAVGSRAAETFVAGPADETDPVLAPGGSLLLYMSRERGASETAELMRMPAAGGPAERVLDSLRVDSVVRCARQPEAPCVLAERVDGQAVLTLLDPTAGRGRELTKLDAVVEVWDLSPDGARIAFATAGRIRVLRVATGESSEILVEDVPEALTWSADGKSVLMTARRGHSSVLLRIDLDGQTRMLWNMDARYIDSPRPSPDARYLVVGVSSIETDTWLIENF
jgi:Tol biopolymer transport system component